MAGFFKVDNDVIDKMKFGNAVEFYVYAIILRYSNGGKMAFPSIEFMRSTIGCSNRKISAALKALEERELIVVYRTPGKNNKYLPFKEQKEIEDVLLKERRENPKDIHTAKLEILKMIYQDISYATNSYLKEAKSIFAGKKMSLEELKAFREAMMNSEFLKGHAGNRPTLRHFGSKFQIDKILSGYYESWEE